MKSFLIVEDNSDLRDMYESLIIKNYKNIHIDHAANGKYALEKAKEIDYTVIIIDINLPLMNGAEFYEALKRNSPALAKRTVFISGSINDSGYEFIFEESRPHLAKPFTQEDFCRLISYIVSKEEEAFLNKHGRPCRRKSARVKAKEECLLVFTNQDSGSIEKLSCKTVNYSTDGFAVIHKEGELPLPSFINVSVNKLNIMKKLAKVVWTKDVDGATLSGLQWV